MWAVKHGRLGECAINLAHDLKNVNDVGGKGVADGRVEPADLDEAAIPRAGGDHGALTTV